MTDRPRYDRIYDGPSVIAKMRAIDAKTPIRAKIEPLLNDTKALVRDRWSDLTKDQRKALEGAVCGFEAALRSIRERELAKFAKAGELAPRRVLYAVEENQS